MSAAQHNAWFFIVVVAGYAGAFTGLSLVLRWGMPLAIAYGVWGASGVALTALLGALLFGDDLTPLMLAGIVLIMSS